jgi:hypothetical protein
VCGIRALQHFSSSKDKKLITLYPSEIEDEHLKSLWQYELQIDGDVVYTDTRLHEGKGFCSFNTAWNVLPLNLFLRSTAADLSSCCPFTFNRKAAMLARQTVGNDSSGGQCDSTTSKLSQKLCHDLPDQTLEAVLLQNRDACREAFEMLVL